MAKVYERCRMVVRQWEVLNALEHDAKTLDELAQAVGDGGVTTSTIRRDIDALQAAGFPIYSNRDAGGRSDFDEVTRWSLLTKGVTPAKERGVSARTSPQHLGGPVPDTQLTPFTLANINAHEREEGRTALDRVRVLAAIAPDVIAAIIASGPLNTSDEFIGAAINSYADQVNGDTVEDIAGDAIAGKDITDALSEISIHASEGGYVLGLAVGLALGSGNPFAGVTKGGGR